MDQDYNESILYSVEACKLAEKAVSTSNAQNPLSWALCRTNSDLRRVLPVHSDCINSLVYTQDGISYLWDVSNPFNLVRLYQLDGDDVAISKDKKLLAASQYYEEFNTIIKLWDMTDMSKPMAVGKMDGNFVPSKYPE